MAALIFIRSNILKQQLEAFRVTCVGLQNYSTDDKAYNLTQLKRGTGGRSSFSGVVATVFGATGFLGRYVCNKLGKIGSQIIIPYRGSNYEPLRLRMCGDLGQVWFTPYNLKEQDTIEKAVKYSNVVVNLVGRDWETKNYKFNDVHCVGAAALARAAREAGVKRFIHVSTLNAQEQPESYLLKGGSNFYKSKHAGELAVLQEFPDATIFRPSDIYGQEDRFIRYYTHMWRRQGQWMPMYKKGECTIKQPVYVSDVAAGIVAAIRTPESAGQIYQAVGPSRYRLSELIDWFYGLMRKGKEWGYWRYDMKYDPFFGIRVTLMNRLSPTYPVGNLHWERIERECGDDQVDHKLPTLEDLGVRLTRMEDQVPWELRPMIAGLYYGFAAEEPLPNPMPPTPI